MSFKPNPMQTLVLFRLLFTGEEPKISDMKQLNPKNRKALADAGLIELEKRGRAQHILLTDKAWAWAQENLDAEISRQARTNEAFEALLLRLKQFLKIKEIPLAGFMAAAQMAAAPNGKSDAQPDQVQMQDPNGDLSERIRKICFALSDGKPNVRIRLKDLRKQIPDVPRDVLDGALLDLQKAGRLVLMHLDDPQERTPEDEAAAIDVLGFKRHILYMEG